MKRIAIVLAGLLVPVACLAEGADSARVMANKKVILCLEEVDSAVGKVFPMKDIEPVKTRASNLAEYEALLAEYKAKVARREGTTYGHGMKVAAERFSAAASEKLDQSRIDFYLKAFEKKEARASFVESMSRQGSVCFLKLSFDNPIVTGLTLKQQLNYVVSDPNGKLVVAGKVDAMAKARGTQGLAQAQQLAIDAVIEKAASAVNGKLLKKEHEGE